MVLNLLHDAWIPVIRRGSGQTIIRPSQLTEDINTDPVMALDWPRADLRVAGTEFLVGLLATSCPPRDGDAWLDAWEVPPTPSALDDAFASISHAFDLDGPGPRFLQDLEDLDSGAEPIERLLFEAAGDSTVKKNTDLLIHRGRYASFSRPAAAIALYTLQAWASSGGAGNRVGLRGGGPMVTMVIPSGSPSLWHTLWTNVPCGEVPSEADLPRVFPWLAPTRISVQDEITTPEDGAHPLQCWWGMPRRIRLDFSEPLQPRTCDLTGLVDSVEVLSWRQRPKGTKYSAWGLRHPLTPHYQQKAGGEWLALHPQPGGVGYQHWLGLVLDSPDGLRLPAAAIALGRSRMNEVGDRSPRLLAAGYDMDSAKARSFNESEMPLPAATNARVDVIAARLVQASDVVSRLTSRSVRGALFSEGATVALDGALLSSVRQRVWSETSEAFFAALERAAQRDPVGADPDLADWLVLLRRTAISLFDEASPLTASSGATAGRIGKARRGLLFALLGYGKEGSALFSALELATPEQKPKGTARDSKPTKGRVVVARDAA